MTVIDEIYKTNGRSADLARRDRRVLCRAVSRIPLAVDRAVGTRLYDADGRSVLDFTSGWNVANTGWNHPEVISAVTRQLESTAFVPPWCTNPRRVEYAERLCGVLGGGYKVLSLTTGSEAIEAALKIARRATARHTIVGFSQAYHGGTLGAMLAGGIEALHGKDVPSATEHRHLPIMTSQRNPDDYCREVCAAIRASPAPAAVLLEPIFTNPGILYANRKFYQELAETTRQVGALLILDEIGTGFGRTGRMFGFEHWDLKPDIIAAAKAISSGVIPMGAAIVRSDLASSVLGPGFLSTFGWTPPACAAAEATLNVLETCDLYGKAREFGESAKRYLRKHLAIDCVHEVRGEGLELGIELRNPDGGTFAVESMRLLTARLLERGLFAETSAFTSTLLMMPPLVIEEPELFSGLEIVVEEIGRWAETNAH